MQSLKLNILPLALLVLASLHAAGQCTPPGGVPVIACGTGTALTNNVTISSGTFNASSGTFSGVTLSGGNLVVCGTVTLSNFTLNSGNLVINKEATVTFNTNYNANGGAFYNSGAVTFNTSVGLQGTTPIAYNAAGASITVNGTLSVFNSGTFYNNGIAIAQSVILNTGAAVCLGNGSIGNVTNLQNNQSNSVTVPSGATACIHYTGSFQANNPAISAGGKLILCQDPAASAPTGSIGSATVMTNCTGCPQSVLPVRLIDFTGTRSGTRVELQWTTALEDNLKCFAVQRSTDGQAFQTVDTLAAHGQPSTYDFTTPLDANTWFRLQMIDRDGKDTYSPIVFVETPATALNMSILSNPIRQSTLSISVNSPVTQNGELTVLDLTGRPLKKLPVSLNTGKNDLQFDLAGLSSGYYYLRFNGTSGQSRTIPFIKL